MPNQVEQEGSGLVLREGKEKEKKRKVQARQRRVTFVNRKVTGRKTISIDKSD